MRILFLTSWLPNNINIREGVFNASRLKALANQGAKIDVIYFNTLAPPINLFFPVPHLLKILNHFRDRLNLKPIINIENVNVIKIKTFHFPNKYKWPKWEQIYYWSSKKVLGEILGKYNYDIIITSRVIPEGAMLSYFIKRINCTVICIAEGGEVLYDAFHYKNWEHTAKKLNNTNFKIISVSNNMSREIIKNNLFNSTTTITNGYDEDLFYYMEKNEKVNNTGITKIITIGRMSPIKGYDILIQALANIKEDFVLTIVGSGNKNYKNTLKSLVIKYNLNDKINFIDNIPNKKVPELLHKNDIFCMPSRSEGFPVAALEATACGLPVIASNVGGLKDIIIDGFNGYLFKNEDIEDLKNKIVFAREKEWDRKKIATHTKNNYGWNKWAKKIIELAK